MFIGLKTDGKINPIAAGTDRIRLSVETEGVLIDGDITYEIFSSLDDVESGAAFIKRTSGKRYEYFDGKAFSDGSVYFWRVTARSGGKEIRSDVATFRTGIKGENFSGKWIDNPYFDGRVSEFKRSFTVESEITEAYLYVVGLGFSDAFINGKKTDDGYFKPLLSDFDKRTGLNNPHYNEDNFGIGKKTVYYDTFDVKNLLREGANEIRVTLGTGWYCNEDKNVTDPDYSYAKPKLFFELRIKTVKGDFIVFSDENSMVRNTNITSQMFACDKVDFTAEEEVFTAARLCLPPTGEMLPNPAENDAVQEEIIPLCVDKKADNFIEYDFGKNHSGGLYLKVKGKRGGKLTINYYENKKDGELNPLSSRWYAYKDGLEIIGYLDQKSEYVLSGGEDVIRPYYHWNCYRYATAECDGEFEVIEIKSLFICSDVKKDGEFWCSDEFLTRFNEAFALTQRDNMHCGVPSDCPTREKLPYTGDGQLVAETVTYSFSAENFYRKWLKDVIDSQGKNGFVAYTAPIIAGGGGFWWSNALTVLPFVVYNFTGDEQVLRDAFEPAKKLVKFYDSVHNGDCVMRKSYVKWFLGDWITPEKTVIDIPYVNTLAAIDATDKVLKMYELLGEEEDKEYYSDFKIRLENAVNEYYWDEKTSDYAGGVQGANLMPALNGVASGERAKKLIKKAVLTYESSPHFDTGIIMTPKVLEVLSAADRYDLGYKILTEKSAPSFYDMLNGETTLVEYWDKNAEGDGAISHCHPMFGSVLCWVYKHLAGLDLSKLCERKITVAPKLVKEVKRSRIEKATSYGRAFVEYDSSDDFKMNLTVPTGLRADVSLPEYIKDITVDGKAKGNAFTLGGGSYKIKAKIN